MHCSGKDGRGRSSGIKHANRRYRRGTDLFRPGLAAGPPSPEPLPSVAGEGFGNRASRHSCSLFPAPCSLFSTLCISANIPINQNSAGLLKDFWFFYKYDGECDLNRWGGCDIMELRRLFSLGYANHRVRQLSCRQIGGVATATASSRAGQLLYKLQSPRQGPRQRYIKRIHGL